MDLAIEREDELDRVLGDRERRVLGHARNRTPERPSRIEIDVVVSGRAQREQTHATHTQRFERRAIDGS
jgi:hypothetical protein